MNLPTGQFLKIRYTVIKKNYGYTAKKIQWFLGICYNQVLLNIFIF